jgi:hypothetical protein
MLSRVAVTLEINPSFLLLLVCRVQYAVNVGLDDPIEQEQESVTAEITELTASVERYEDGSGRAAKFIELVGRYGDFTEMTVQMLNEFVEKIVVHERDRKGAIYTDQKVEIHLNFIGEYKVPKEPIDPAEAARREEEKREIDARRNRLHENYLRRKKSGKQQEYERRYNERRRAQYARRKAAAEASRTHKERAAPPVTV